MKKMGVYQMYCSVTGRAYVGSTTGLSHRRSQHLSDLRHKNHISKKMQEDYDLYGEDKFYFMYLEDVTDSSLLLQREQHWIDLLKPEYNAELKAGCSTIHVNRKEVKEKISRSVKKLWLNPEYRERCSIPRNWKKGIPNRRGAVLSDETKQKIRLANTGSNNPNYGKPRSQSFIDNMSKTYDGAIDPEGVVHSPITNLSSFCREHNLDTGQMSRVLNGKAKSHKGWIRV